MIAILNTGNELEINALSNYASEKNLKITWINDMEELEDHALYNAMMSEPSERIPIEKVEQMLMEKINASRSK